MTRTGGWESANVQYAKRSKVSKAKLREKVREEMIQSKTLKKGPDGPGPV